MRGGGREEVGEEEGRRQEEGDKSGEGGLR